MKSIDNNKLVKVAVFDADGTIIKGYAEALFLKSMIRTGTIKPFTAIIVSGLFMLFKLGLVRNAITIRGLVARELKSISASRLRQILATSFATDLQKATFPEAKSLINDLKSEGYTIVISTAAFEIIADIYKQILPVDIVIGTKLEISNDKLTGRITGLANYGTNKLTNIKTYLQDIADFKNSFAYANDFSDIEMMSCFGNPVACHPEKKLRAHAKQNGWKIIDCSRSEA